MFCYLHAFLLCLDKEICSGRVIALYRARVGHNTHFTMLSSSSKALGHQQEAKSTADFRTGFLQCCCCHLVG